MTTAVYFDLDGTLLDYERPFDEILDRTLPVDATPEIAETFTDRLLSGLANVEPDPYERAFAATCEEHGVDADPSDLAAAHVRNEVEATRLAPSVRRLVEAVATRHQTGVLTNGDGRMQRRKIEIHGLDDVVDTTLVSNELGARKPDPAVFEEAKDRLPADVYVYVGDGYEEDISPAEELGFETVYVGDEPQPEVPVSAAGTAALAPVLLALLDG